jgi:hypothetical protein
VSHTFALTADKSTYCFFQWSWQSHALPPLMPMTKPQAHTCTVARAPVHVITLTS